MASTAGRALVAEGDRLVAEALAAHLRRDGFQPVSLLQLSARMRGKAGSALPSTNGKASARRVPAKKEHRRHEQNDQQNSQNGRRPHSEVVAASPAAKRDEQEDNKNNELQSQEVELRP